MGVASGANPDARLWESLPRWLSGKGFACQHRRHGFNPWVRKILWRREWQPTPVFLPGKKRSLVGYSPWGHKESDATKQLNNSNNEKTARPVMSDCRPPRQEHRRQRSL